MRDLIEPTAAEVEQARWALQYRYRQIAALNARDAASQRNRSKGEESVERTNLTTDRPCCGPTARAMARVRDLWIAAEVDR